MKILIIGGGIGGMTAAISLHQAGFEVEVFESVPTLKPLGVGINLLPHSVRVLTNLGLQDRLSETAVATRELVYFNKFGQRFWDEPRGMFAGYRWPQFSIHRGELQMLLFRAAQENIGQNRIHTGHHLHSFVEQDNQVYAKFVDKDSGEILTEVKGDLLIGADGIHSVVRQHFYPNEGPPKFSGNVLYRGVTKMKSFLTGSSMAMIGYADKKMVVYPIHQTLDEDGKQLINWVGDIKAEDVQFSIRDWNRQADKQKLLPQFESWRFDWLDVYKLIEGAANIYEFPMSDRDPLERWSFGRITLLGDAAHPMYPIGSNGASQAILDVDALTESLQSHPDPVAALQQYESIRLPATAKVVLQNRQQGPDHIMQVMEERAPNGFSNPYEVMSFAEMDAMMSQYRRIAGFDRDTLNQKA
ncbi:MAG: flavin-dependent oxidoreductase [Acidobacteria bacterium]|nr:flavin-dependent oxidoreductase [Acidobacteriota bacterium]